MPDTDQPKTTFTPCHLCERPHECIADQACGGYGDDAAEGALDRVGEDMGSHGMSQGTDKTTKVPVVACIFGAAIIFAFTELAAGFWVEAQWHCEPSDMLCAIERHRAGWSHMMLGQAVALCGLVVAKISKLFGGKTNDEF